MHPIDWLVILAYLVWIVHDGLKRTRSSNEMDGYLLAKTVLAIGVPTAVYTMFGGVQAVAWTDVKQMAVVVFGVPFC